MRALDDQASELMTMFRELTARVKRLKSKPESGSSRNSTQVGFVDRRLKAANQKYQELDAQFQRQLKDQMARQYRIVRPDASEAEVRDAVEDTSSQQVFSQALLSSTRRADVQSTMSAVQSRHQEIQKIERQMIELAELFQDMDNLVVQQEAAVTNIEMKGEEVVENMDKGTEQIGVAIKSARNARKWKWWCLGITGTFLLIHFFPGIWQPPNYLDPHTFSKNPTNVRNSPHHCNYRHCNPTMAIRLRAQRQSQQGRHQKQAIRPPFLPRR
jgi:syntaxin 1B/2/3